MTFSDYVNKYWEKKRPSGDPWLRDAILKDSGLNPATLDIWIAFAQEYNAQLVQREGRHPTDAELIARFAALHPAPSYGDILGPTGSKPTIGQMSQEEFWIKQEALLRRILDK